MVLTHGHMDGWGVASWDQEVTAGFFAGVVIEDFLCAAAENYHPFTSLYFAAHLSSCVITMNP